MSKYAVHRGVWVLACLSLISIGSVARGEEEGSGTEIEGRWKIVEYRLPDLILRDLHGKTVSIVDDQITFEVESPPEKMRYTIDREAKHITVKLEKGSDPAVVYGIYRVSEGGNRLVMCWGTERPSSFDVKQFATGFTAAEYPVLITLEKM